MARRKKYSRRKLPKFGVKRTRRMMRATYRPGPTKIRGKSKYIRRTGKYQRVARASNRTVQTQINNPLREMTCVHRTVPVNARVYEEGGSQLVKGWAVITSNPTLLEIGNITFDPLYGSSSVFQGVYGFTRMESLYKYFSPLSLKTVITISNHSNSASLTVVYFTSANHSEWDGHVPADLFKIENAKTFIIPPRGTPGETKRIKIFAKVRDYITDSPMEERYRSDKEGKSTGMSDTVIPMRTWIYLLSNPMMSMTIGTTQRNALNADVRIYQKVAVKWTGFKGATF